MLRICNKQLNSAARVAVRQYSKVSGSSSLKSKIELKSIHVKKAEDKLLTMMQKLSIAEKERRAKVEKEAFKAFRGVTGFSLFIKEVVKSNNMAEASKQWKALDERERAEWAEKAEVHNAAERKRFPPRPQPVLNGYAAFMKEQAPLSNGANFAEISAIVAARWGALSKEEKDAYKPTEAEKSEYKRVLAIWEETRMKAYLEKKAEMLAARKANDQERKESRF